MRMWLWIEPKSTHCTQSEAGRCWGSCLNCGLNLEPYCTESEAGRFEAAAWIVSWLTAFQTEVFICRACHHDSSQYRQTNNAQWAIPALNIQVLHSGLHRQSCTGGYRNTFMHMGLNRQSCTGGYTDNHAHGLHRQSCTGGWLHKQSFTRATQAIMHRGATQTIMHSGLLRQSCTVSYTNNHAQWATQTIMYRGLHRQSWEGPR